MSEEVKTEQAMCAAPRITCNLCSKCQRAFPSESGDYAEFSPRKPLMAQSWECDGFILNG